MEEQNRRHVSVFEDDEIPYEVRMKHLIKAYRKDLKRLEELSQYAKGLEEENMLLQKKIEKSGTSEETSKEVIISRMKSEISQLKGALTKTFPKRVIQMRDARKKIISLQDYILSLQSLLTANGIAYEERQVKSSKAESINPVEMDIFAVRGHRLLVSLAARHNGWGHLRQFQASASPERRRFVLRRLCAACER